MKKIEAGVEILGLREAREARGLTREQLATKAGTTVSLISNVENGNYDYDNLSTSLLCSIAHALRCKLSVQLEDLDEDETPRSAA